MSTVQGSAFEATVSGKSHADDGLVGGLVILDEKLRDSVLCKEICIVPLIMNGQADKDIVGLKEKVLCKTGPVKANGQNLIFGLNIAVYKKRKSITVLDEVDLLAAPY